MMNTKKNLHTIAKIAVVNSRLSELAIPIAELREKDSVLKAHIETVEEGIASRDWIFTGRRPRGCIESASAAEQMRHRLHSEHKQIVTRLAEVKKQLTPLSREQSQLRCDLSYLEQAAITPEQFQPEIDRLEVSLAELQSQRNALVQTLEDSQIRLERASEAEREEEDATERLTAARANAFLATPSEAMTRTDARSMAEAALASACEKASSARAATPIIIAHIKETTSALALIAENIEQQQVLLSEKQSHQQKVIALAEWALIVEQARVGLRTLLAADRTTGRLLAGALMREGFKEFDYRGRLVRPAWLATDAT